MPQIHMVTVISGISELSLTNFVPGIPYQRGLDNGNMMYILLSDTVEYHDYIHE